MRKHFSTEDFYGKFMSFNQRVYEIVKQVPLGKVTTYGAIARAIGAPRSSRQVGWALHVNPQPGVIPCHRVLFRDGSLTDGFAFGGRDVQRAMLEAEGVKVSDDYKVDLAEFGWY